MKWRMLLAAGAVLLGVSCASTESEKATGEPESAPEAGQQEEAAPEPASTPAPAEDSTPLVAIDTSHGTIAVELDPARAPESVASFLDNVETGFYEGTIFHRVIQGFMIQGGGMTPDMRLKPTGKQLVNEADNGLKNLRGTIAMARKSSPHSASVQFYINHADNDFLDHTAKTNEGWGYAVFGRVVEGMDVVDSIATTPTARGDVPVEQVTIERARRLQ